MSFLKRASDALWRERNSKGELICPKHRLDHTGKTCYGVIIDLAIFDVTGDRAYLKRAEERGDFVFLQIRPHPQEKETWLVYPGSTGKRNMSNTVIDSGAGIDSLATMISHPQNTLGKEKKEKWKQAIAKVCESHLIKDVLNKEIPNQRVWGSTGLAAAAHLFNNPEWKSAVVGGIERTLADMSEDGFFAYHPCPEKFGLFSGASDITLFYHSRHLGFIFYVLETANISPEPYLKKLDKGLKALLGMLNSDGTKPLALECKRWYWHGSYEVASFSFDIYALVQGWKTFKNPLYKNYALALLQNLMDHQNKRGFIIASKEPCEQFQCPIFWTSHVAWIARAYNQLQEPLSPISEPSVIQRFPQSGITKIVGENYEAIIREKSKPVNIAWGAGVSGGQLLSFLRKKGGMWKNRLIIDHYNFWEGTSPGSWTFKPEGLVSLNYIKSFWLANATDLWRQLYYLRVEAEAKHTLAFLHLVWVHFIKSVLAVFRYQFSTQWSSALKTNSNSTALILRMQPSNREKTILLTTDLLRKYEIGDNLLVEDKILIRENMKKIVWHKSPAWKIEHIKTLLPYVKKGDKIIFSPCLKNAEILIKYVT